MLKDVRLPGGKKGAAANVLNIAIIVLIIIIIVKVYKAFKATSNVAGQAVGNEVIAATIGIPVTRVVYIRSEATRLWRSGVWSVLWVRNYNEEMFIATINEMVTPKEVGLLDQLYQEASGERLKDAIDASFKDSDRAKVNAQWLAIING